MPIAFLRRTGAVTEKVLIARRYSVTGICMQRFGIENYFDCSCHGKW